MVTPIQKLIADADSILSGKHPDALLDWRDAADMYKTAGEFGSGEAFSKLAQMYRDIRPNGKYFKKDLNKALSLHKKAVTLAYYDSIVLLSGTYLQMEEIDDAIKVFKIYFDKLTDSEYSIITLSWYVTQCLKNNKSSSIDERLFKFSDGILDSMEGSIKFNDRMLSYINQQHKENKYPYTMMDIFEIHPINIDSFSKAQIYYKKIYNDTEEMESRRQKFLEILEKRNLVKGKIPR